MQWNSKATINSYKCPQPERGDGSRGEISSENRTLSMSFCLACTECQNHENYTFYFIMQFPSVNPTLFAYQRWHKKDTYYYQVRSIGHIRKVHAHAYYTWPKILNQVSKCLLANESPIISFEVYEGYTTWYTQSPVLNLFHLKCCSPLSRWSKKAQLTGPISWNLETLSYVAPRYFYF